MSYELDVPISDIRQLKAAAHVPRLRLARLGARSCSHTVSRNIFEVGGKRRVIADSKAESSILITDIWDAILDMDYCTGLLNI